MSANVPAASAINFRAAFASGQSTESLTVMLKFRQVTDPNAITPCVMVSDDAGQYYGIYTDTDGTTMKFGGGGLYDPSSSIGTLTTGAYKTIGWTGGASNTWTPYMDGVAGSVWTPTLQGAFTARSIWFANDASTSMDALIGYVLVLNYKASAAEMAAFAASSAPWDLASSSAVMLKGSLVGADIGAVMATMTGPTGVGVNPGTATQSATDATFGPIISGSTILDIA